MTLRLHDEARTDVNGGKGSVVMAIGLVKSLRVKYQSNAVFQIHLGRNAAIRKLLELTSVM